MFQKITKCSKINYAIIKKEKIMTHFFMSGGPMMWLLLLIALVVLVLFIKKAVQLFSGSTSP